MIHEEVDTVASFTAAETFVDILSRRNRKRRGLFIMERTKTQKVSASLLEHHIVFDRVLHLGGVKDLRYGALRYQ